MTRADGGAVAALVSPGQTLRLMSPSSSRPAFLLFQMPDGSLSGTPEPIDPASFEALGALEVQHLERWLVSRPEVLGEELLVVTNQFAGFDKTRERSDILALDQTGKLVIVELKRDSSGSRQDLQALRYAAYSATLGLDDLAELYAAHLAKAGRTLSKDEALTELEEHVADGDLQSLTDDARPRIILVAKSFQVEVTATCLWLRESYGVDISCVQLVPYRVDGRVLIASSVLIPLPEASEYTVKRERKRHQAQDEEAERYAVRRRFWAALLERAKPRTELHSGNSANTTTWLVTSAGKRGMLLCYVIRQHDAGVVLIIDRGAGAGAETTAIFEELEGQRVAIEADFGGSLDWDRSEGRQRCQIGVTLDTGGYRDSEERWPETQDEMIESMIRLEQALRRPIDALPY